MNKLLSSLAVMAFAAATFSAAAQTTPAAPATPAPAPNQAIITIDVNGKKETKVIELPAGVSGSAALTINADGSSKVITGSSVVPGAGTLTINGNAVTPHVVSSGTFTASAVGAKPVTWLGVSTESISDEIAAQLPIDAGTGVIVQHVMPESPAFFSSIARAGRILRAVRSGTTIVPPPTTTTSAPSPKASTASLSERGRTMSVVAFDATFATAIPHLVWSSVR